MAAYSIATKVNSSLTKVLHFFLILEPVISPKCIV